MKTIELSQTDSTNSWIARNAGDLDGECLVYALDQTSGRGQRGNSWESEPGMNLTASALLHPDGIEPQCQFLISEAVALAVVDFLDDLGVAAKVKWPNDIYAGDDKICGILIEHSIIPGKILRTIAGVGININQTLFLSDAPNPVSVKQLTGREHHIPTMARSLADRISARMNLISGNLPDDSTAGTSTREKIHSEFMSRLWRHDGKLHPFFDRIREEHIHAEISGVGPDGILSLTTGAGEIRRYAFKEIEFILSKS